MESDLLIGQEEVGAKGEYDVSKRMMEILFWDVVDPNEVVLEPNEALLKRPGVEESGKRQPDDLKHHRKCTRINKASTSKELENKCKLHDPKINGLSKDVKNQDQQAAYAQQATPQSLRKGLRTAALLLPWMIWKHRNNCVFERVQPSIARLMASIKEEAALWVQAGTLGLRAALPATWDVH